MTLQEILPTTSQFDTYADIQEAYEKERRALLAKAARLTGALHEAQADKATGPSSEAMRVLREVQTSIDTSVQKMAALALRITTFDNPKIHR